MLCCRTNRAFRELDPSVVVEARELGSHSQHLCLNRLKDRTCKPVIRVRAPAGAFRKSGASGGTGYGRESFRQHRRGRRRETGAAPWAARSPFRPEADRDLMLVPRVRGDWTADERAREALARIAADPAVAEVREHAKGVDVRLDDEWIEARGEALEAGGDPDANADLAAGGPLRRLLLGRQHDQGPPHRPPAQPGARQRDRRGAAGRRRQGREPQPDLRRRPQHGRGDGGSRRLRPRRRRARRRRRREVRPLRRPLLRRLRQGRAGRRWATTAPRTRSPARRRSTTTRPTS